MSLVDFQALVDDYIKENIYGSVTRTIFGETSKNQFYAIIVNKVIWYAVRLVIYTDFRCHSFYQSKIYQNFDLEMVNREIEKISNCLKNDAVLFPLSSYHKEMKMSYLTRKLDEKERKNPFSFFHSGDHIQINRNYLYFHHAIYIGNRKVIQVSRSNNQVEECYYDEFIGNDTVEISLICYLFRTKSKTEIIQTALNLRGVARFKYNCKRFAFICSTGSENDELVSSPIVWRIRKI